MGFFITAPAVSAASEITPEKVAELVNRDRIQNGFEPLRVNEALTRAAQAKADDMTKNDYFAHTSPEGLTPWHWIQGSDYNYRSAGENLAIHFTDAEEEERAWMESVKHRENILSPKYQDIGVAVNHTVQNGQPTTIVVQMFGLLSGSIVQEKARDAIAPMSKSVESAAVTSPVEPIDSMNSSKKSSYEPSVESVFLEMMMNAARWISFIAVGIMTVLALAIAVLNRKALFLKLFRKNQVFEYRG